MSDEKESSVEKEQQPENELEVRISSFLSEYGELVKKHQIDFATYPFYTPDGQGWFKTGVRTTPVDISKQPTTSDFMSTNVDK